MNTEDNKNNFKQIETKWQKVWEENKELYRAKSGDSREKKYVLVEFPYPSGSGLHVGHAFSFTGGDVCARFKRMQGYNVLFPMGWDAFGLPTENYAIKTKQKPQKVTKDNTDMFRSQMKRLAFSFDWSREVNTTDPNYYKRTQWIFIKLFEKGLAHKEEMPINWCPSCKIGLANEEVVNGHCERCGAEVSRRNISQWIVKITDYADRLTEGLKETAFIEKVKMAQVNWIGRKEGLTIDFVVDAQSRKISCFTKYPETIFGVSWVVVSPEYPELSSLVTDSQKEAVVQYIKESSKKSEMDRTSGTSEKTGVFTGSYVINPVNNKKIPIWVGDYVLANFGTGAVMGVGPHDSRDFMFAQKYGLEMMQVEVPEGQPDYVIDSYEKVIEDGVMVNSGKFNGMRARDEAYKAICDWMVENKWAIRKVEYHLRDWIFSRQHYWGEPIPMIFCKNCAENQNLKISNLKFKNEEERQNAIKNAGWWPVVESELPIVLPEVEHYEPTDTGESPLANIEEFVKRKCPKCGGEAKRETDTMPNWAGSDWYFLAYVFADKLGSSDIVGDIFSDSRKELDYWGPVDVYIGGDEHNTLHLLYSRFIYQFLYDLGVLPEGKPEPYYKRISHGVILGPDNQRMSKSRGNVIVPEVVADKYGVDVLRLYLMFMGPFDGTMAWNEKTLMGVKRFLDRVEKTVNSDQFTVISSEHRGTDFADRRKGWLIILNKAIKSITEDLENFGYNTVVAKLMRLLTDMEDYIEVVTIDDLKMYIKLLAPMAPYTAEELWAGIGGEVSVHSANWPESDEKYLVEDKVVVVVSVNGKMRDQMEVETDKKEDQEHVLALAKGREKIKQWIEGKEVVREIFVPGKMVNLVVR